MQTANKLAQLARANQDKQKQVDVYKNGQLVFTGKQVDAEIFMNNEGGVFDIKPAKNHHLSFEKKVRWGSHQYVRYVVNQCKELASKGYGSVEIKIDRTTDLFQIDEGRNSCYSAEFVSILLQQNGFVFDGLIDHYDAFSTILTWDKELPQAPSSMKIGMCWK